MNKSGYHIAVVGATGAVGVEILRVLERRGFPVADLKLLASSRSAGKRLAFNGREYVVGELNSAAFADIDYAFFSAGATRSRQFVDAAIQAGAVVVDNSSAFRMRADVPLVVPEVNPRDLQDNKGLIANPNCCAAILAVAIWPLHVAFGIKRIVVSTYQSASGAGAQAMAELEEQVKAYADGQPITHKVFPHQIAFNLFSHNTKVMDNGYNEEENKLVEEIRKMFHAPALPIVPTCIRVPVLRAHSESVVIETERPVSVARAREILSHSAGVKLVDDAPNNHFPMPLEATGDLDVHVGRLRLADADSHSLALFISGDQLLKGAAWNAVQIAEELIKHR
ncbi:MAG: aspartate-semialdehyde dehydrogenase [Verrucomicrobiales bacterium]|jgi:aspartate-semialdehyde dehydrogenase|nr:aspartate-semialdehyde dehydrogenase [Verrucomicrobiales bacterium]